MPQPESLFGDPCSILITGASSGIGAALAVELARYGGRLALVARREEQLRAVAERATAAGCRALAVSCDVTDADAVRRAHDQITATQGPIDVAFLNAGVGELVNVAHFDGQRVRRMFEVNVFGVTNWIEALLPQMIGRGRGVLAVTSSLAAHCAIPGNSAYSASKAAVTHLLDGLRGEAQSYGIQISTIEPGYVRTPMTAANRRMPFLVEPEEAARIAVDGVAEGRRVIRFPWPMIAAVQVLGHLPLALYDRVSARMVRKKKK
jgi:short-subunit dehydrogenase